MVNRPIGTIASALVLVSFILAACTDPAQDAFAQYEATGVIETVERLEMRLNSVSLDRHEKRSALVSLGKIGTREALRAIEAFEAQANARHGKLPQFLIRIEEGSSRSQDWRALRVFSVAKDGAGKRWGLMEFPLRYGRMDLSLVQVHHDQRVENPILLDLPIAGNGTAYLRMKARNAVTLEFGPGAESFAVNLGGERFPFTLSAVTRDSDEDGIPDLVEEGIFMDKSNADCDGDGILDGQDANPLTPASDSTSDGAQIRQAVFTLFYGTDESLEPLLLAGTAQEYRGYRGKVIRLPREIARGRKIEIRATEISKDRATADFTDSSNGWAIELRKIHGKWVVAGFRNVRNS